MFLNVLGYSWLFLDILEYSWTFFNILEYSCMICILRSYRIQFIARSAIYVGGVFWRDVHLFACCLLLLSQILVIFCKGICTGVRHMLTGVLIKRLTICCFSPKWTSFISELGAVTVDSGSLFFVIFTKSDQFHQRVRGGKGGQRSLNGLTSYCSRRADGGRQYLDPKYLNFQKYLNFRISIYIRKTWII